MCNRGPFSFVLFQIVTDSSDHPIDVNFLKTLGRKAAVIIKDEVLCWRDWWGCVNVVVFLYVDQSYISSVDHNQSASRLYHPERSLSRVAK
jgi:hypothetical protein